MRSFMTPQELQGRLYADTTLVADCRGDLADLTFGLTQYLANHIPGAVFIDGEEVLSGPKERHGGRHPLPDPVQFAQVMGTNGLTKESVVVAYGMYAARLVVLLNLIGHRTAFVLDGHIEGWLMAGYPVTRTLPNRRPTRYQPNEDATLVVDVAGVRKHRAAQDAVLVDVRSAERFRGTVEPIDKVAGHIPGAVNIPWESNFDGSKQLRPAAELTAIYAPYLTEKKEFVIYCGSGVTSCNTLLALREVGLPARLYAGSWSDWISYPDNPVATGAV